MCEILVFLLGCYLALITTYVYRRLTLQLTIANFNIAAYPVIQTWSLHKINTVIVKKANFKASQTSGPLYLFLHPSFIYSLWFISSIQFLVDIVVFMFTQKAELTVWDKAM